MNVRRVEFTGIPSAWSDPKVKALQAEGRLTRADRERLRRLETLRQENGYARFPGATMRILGVRVCVERGGGYLEPKPLVGPVLGADGRLVSHTLADGWSEHHRVAGRLDDGAAEGKLVEVRGETYAALPGWDRVYVFGPHDFVQAMTSADVARLFADPFNRRLFRDLEAPLLIFPGGDDLARVRG